MDNEPKYTKHIYLFDTPFNSTHITAIAQQFDRAVMDDQVEQIQLIISSGGGDRSCVALFELIRLCSKRVDTLAVGYCASAAVTLLQAGKIRRATKNSFLLIHGGEFGLSGKVIDMEEKIKNWYKRDTTMRKLNADRMGLKLKDYLALEASENLLTAQEALKLNLIDEII
jgi:ATP-dependent protease ClpP protease subunit